MPEISEFLYSWNPCPAARLASLKIEDDTLRDGLQGAFVHQPDTAGKKELVRLSAEVGCHAAMLGFPASSRRDFAESWELVRFLEAEGLPLVPRFLARASVGDVEPIIEIDRSFSRDVWADFFINCSPIRRQVEQWELPDLLKKIRATGERLATSGTRFGVSLEDATRTPPEDLFLAVRTALAVGAEVVTLCDTVGDALPAGAAALVAAVNGCVRALGSRAEIWWHGHNDRGLSLANALAAAEAGADAISGTFLGIGERAGNTPIEQVIICLTGAGHSGFRLDRIAPYCSHLAAATGMGIPANAPLVGSQAFATCTGTHGAAILKARQLGVSFEDYVFSSVPATALGSRQSILVGPTSGIANARYVLHELELEATPDNAQRLLTHSKQRNACLTPDEIRQLCADRVPVTKEG